jgi:hypothetical protein
VRRFLLLLLPPLLWGAPAPAWPAQLEGSLVISGESSGNGDPSGSTSLEFSVLAGSASLAGRFSGAYRENEGGARVFDLSETLLEFRSPRADVSAGDISPYFSDYTLSSPSNEYGAEANVRAAGFSFRPVYLLLAAADEGQGVFERKLYGASLSKEDLPLGFSLAGAAYRSADDQASLKAPAGAKPLAVETLGVKAGFKTGDVFSLFYEFARSAADEDTTDAAAASGDQAVKGGLGLNWDRWTISARYSRCDKDFRAAGADAVDSDQSKLSADLAFAFSDYVNARVSESRITDGLSKGRNERIDKQNSLFSVGFSFPGLPSAGLDYNASRNRNRVFAVNDETEDFGYSLNYAFLKILTGLSLTANGRLSKARDFTRKTDPAETVTHNLGLNVPAAPLNLTPNYSFTRNENTRTGARTYYETVSLAVSAAAFSGKAALNVSGSRSLNYDNRNTVDTATQALSSQLALALSSSVRFTVGAAFSSTKDAVNPAGTLSSRQYSASTAITF